MVYIVQAFIVGDPIILHPASTRTAPVHGEHWHGIAPIFQADLKFQAFLRDAWRWICAIANMAQSMQSDIVWAWFAGE